MGTSSDLLSQNFVPTSEIGSASTWLGRIGLTIYEVESNVAAFDYISR